MKQKKKNEKKRPRDRIRWWAVGALVITGVVLSIIGSENDNTALTVVGAAMLPGAGIVITPRVVREAFNDNKSWKSRGGDQRNKLYRAGMFGEVSDMLPYQSKLLWGVRREALWNLFILLLVLGGVLVGCWFGIVNGSAKNEFASFLLIIGIVTFGIPIAAYNIACSVYRIRTVKRRGYDACRTVVKGANGLHMWIMDDKERVIKFDYCRRLGIRAKDIHDTKVILVFVPDEVYLLPDRE